MYFIYRARMRQIARLVANSEPYLSENNITKSFPLDLLLRLIIPLDHSVNELIFQQLLSARQLVLQTFGQMKNRLVLRSVLAMQYA